MPITAGSTRRELEVNVGYILGAIKEIESDTTGTTATFVTDDIPIVTADGTQGLWINFTNETDDGAIRQVTDSTVSSNSNTITFFPAITTAPTDTSTANLWSQHYDPVAIRNFINQSIKDATGYVFDPVEDISLHTGGGKVRFDIPTTFELLQDIYLRDLSNHLQIIASGVVWDESVDTDFTITQDTEDPLFGRTPTKFVIGSGVSAGDIATDSFSSLDLSKFTHIEFGIKVRDAVVSDDLRIILSATTNGGSETEVITIPAISAITDTWVRVAMTAPSAATAIISVALEYNANQGDNIVWLTEIEATVNDEDDWGDPLPRHLWSIDKESRDLTFPFGLGGYNLIKLKGGDNPVLLTADSTVTEVPENYIIYHTAGLALRRPIRGESPDQAQVRMRQSDAYMGIAAGHKRNFPPLINGRFCT